VLLLEMLHVHIHVIPRFADKPIAGCRIRSWLKEEIRMTIKQLKFLLESLPEDLNVVVDVADFGQETIKSAKIVEMYKGNTAHGKVYYENISFFMGDDATKETVVYLSGDVY
jgi:hypothetical protein